MAKRRLLRQLSPIYLLLVSLAVALVVWFAVHSFENFWLAESNARTLEIAQSVVDQLSGELDDEELSDEDTALLDRLHGGAIHLPRILVLAPKGAVLYDSAHLARDGDNWIDRPEVRRALRRETGSSVRPSGADGERTLFLAMPVIKDGQLRGVVEAMQLLGTATAATRQFQMRLTWLGLGIVALATLALPLFSRQITRPIDEMRHAAEQFARGDLGYKLVVPESEEFAGLAEALNLMAVQLQERIGTIVRQSNEQQAVLASMVEGVLAVDNQERVISLNKASAQLLGLDPDQAQGRSLQEVVRNADLRRFIKRAIHCREPIDDDVVVHGDHEGVLQARGAALHDAMGRAIGAVVVLNDVTDFRRLEYIRRDFVANVSHELKTPITSIKGFVETLLDGAIDDPVDAQRFLQIVARQADRLNSIIEDLLSLSKIEQGEEASDIQLALGRVKDVLDGAVHNCLPKAEERQIHICTACDQDVVANMNPALLEQAVTNLLDNALKYSEPGGEVQVLASRMANEVTITVSDRGCGIAAEHLVRIFERFYRVDKARSRKLGGTGLGLAIVKHIVQAHRGHVTLKSTPGIGSVFTIHLPLPTVALPTDPDAMNQGTANGNGVERSTRSSGETVL